MRFWPDSAKSSTPKIQVQEQRYDDIAFSHSSLQVTSQGKGLQLIVTRKNFDFKINFDTKRKFDLKNNF